jgi:hypothetical protein
MRSIACTIVSANYLAYAATLRDSLQTTDPDLAFKVLLVDAPSDAALAIVKDLRLDVVWLETLELPAWRMLAFRYSVLELNTIVKPAFLLHLLDLGFDRVIYSDPDTLYFSSLEKALEPAQGKSIALTPHLLTDTGPIDDELILLQTGIFNLGFVSVTESDQTRRFLQWWSSRCAQAGFDDVASGQYTDQKWVNFVPALFPDHHVLRNPALNVAYWNIHERKLSRCGDTVLVNGESLVFFHFSGIARTTSELSRHKSVERSLSTDIALSMAESYRQKLEANGHMTLKGTPYAFDCFDDGAPILSIHRIALQHCADQPGIDDPFCAKGMFAERLRRSPLWPRHRGAATFRPASSGEAGRKRQELGLSQLMKVFARLLGPSRYWYLCKYLSLRVSPLTQRREIRGLLGLNGPTRPSQ